MQSTLDSQTDTSRTGPASCDVAVIGAGIGGLAAAALLSKTGMKVRVLEMASGPGGCLAGFDRGEFHFETAIHWLNQCGPTGFVRRVFDFIAPGAPATVPNTRIRRYVDSVSDYLLTTNPDELRDLLLSQYPADEKKIRAFFRASRLTAEAFSKMSSMFRSLDSMSLLQKLHFLFEVNKAALPLMYYSLFSAQWGLSRFFNNEAIRRIFGEEKRLLSCLVPVGWAYDNDYQIPPQRGSRAFAQWLCEVLAQRDAGITYGARVSGIMLDGGKAAGVRYTCAGQEHELRARYVIAACDVETLYARLLPQGIISEKLLRKVRTADIFNSCITLSIGLDCPAAELGLNEEQVMLKRSGSASRSGAFSDPLESDINIIAPSFRDPTLAPPGKGAITIYVPCSISYGNHWETQRGPNGEFIRGEEYKAFKQRCADRLLDRVEQGLIPALRRHIEVLDVATPVTYLRYTGNRNGAIMGFRPSFGNVVSRVARYTTPVPNLIIGSQWAELGGGVPLAIKTGVNSALLILKREDPQEYQRVCGVFKGVQNTAKKS